MVLMLKGIEQEIRMVREQTSEILEERVEEVKKEFAESLQDQTVRFKQICQQQIDFRQKQNNEKVRSELYQRIDTIL